MIRGHLAQRFLDGGGGAHDLDAVAVPFHIEASLKTSHGITRAR
ncbi:MAG TPA: hypothetical protein VF134_03125 [Candidatus Dormibacteraeota bacterium]